MANSNIQEDRSRNNAFYICINSVNNINVKLWLFIYKIKK